jgi:DedD protein
MEKEQKKLLLVAVSVGVFLLVTITVALLILTPKTQMREIDYYSSFQFQPRVQSSENLNNTPQPVINNTQETKINFDFENTDLTATVDSNDEKRLSIQISKQDSTAITDSKENTPSTTASTDPKPATAEPVKTTSVKSTSTPEVPAKPVASATVTQVKTTASSKTINDFWIQTGAFSQKFRADDAKELLASKGFVSIIENREIDGQTLYRVRLGPYTSENEANYWLTLVKSIDGFNASQVRQTIR